MQTVLACKARNPLQLGSSLSDEVGGRETYESVFSARLVERTSRDHIEDHRLDGLTTALGLRQVPT